MARLPVPGSDNGTWGDILNEYLSQTLKPDGTIKDDAVTATQIANGTITEAQFDNEIQTKLNSNDRTEKATLTTKGDMYVASSTSTPVRLGVGADGHVLTADSTETTGVKWTEPIASGLGYATNVGDGTSGPFTITHNLGSRDVLVNVYKNTGTFEEILVRTDRVTPNTVVLRPDEIWTTNQYRAVVGFAAQSDVTPPTAPTLVHTGHDISSVSLSLSGSTDANGITGYNWYRDSSYIANTTGTTYTHTNLNSATSYDFTATAVDIAGNESVPSNTVTQMTDAPADVAYASTGTGNRDTSDGVTSWSHVVGAGASRYMIVGLVVSHTGGHWGNYTTYTTRTVSSDLNGELTFLGGANLGVVNQWTGSVILFGIANPTVGTHTISTSISRSGVPLAVLGNSVCYTGVGSVGTAVSYQPNASGALALSVSSAVNSMVVGVAGFDAAPTSNSGTVRYSDGGAIGGSGDYGFIVDAPGAATVNFTTSSSSHYRAGVGINLVKAG